MMYACLNYISDIKGLKETEVMEECQQVLCLKTDVCFPWQWIQHEVAWGYKWDMFTVQAAEQASIYSLMPSTYRCQHFTNWPRLLCFSAVAKEQVFRYVSEVAVLLSVISYCLQTWNIQDAVKVKKKTHLYCFDTNLYR